MSKGIFLPNLEKSGELYRTDKTADYIYLETHENSDAETLTLLSTEPTLVQSDNAVYDVGFYRNWAIRRVALTIDCSSLPAGASITSAKLVFPKHTLYADKDAYIVQGLFGSSLSLSDYGAQKSATTSGGTGSAPLSNVSGTSFQYIALNATGRSWITKAGNTLLGLRMKADVNATEPVYGDPYRFWLWFGDPYTYWSGSVVTVAVSGIQATFSVVVAAHYDLTLEVDYTGADSPPYPRVRFNYYTDAHYYTDWQTGIGIGDTLEDTVSGLPRGTLCYVRGQREGWEGATIRNTAYVTFTTAPEPGFRWVDGRRFYFTSELDKKHIEGRYAGYGATAGHHYVEGLYLVYIDEAGHKRKRKGYKKGATGVDVSNGCPVWVEKTKIRYIDANGDERFLPIWWFNTDVFNRAIFNA